MNMRTRPFGHEQMVGDRTEGELDCAAAAIIQNLGWELRMSELGLRRPGWAAIWCKAKILEETNGHHQFLRLVQGHSRPEMSIVYVELFVLLCS